MSQINYRTIEVDDYDLESARNFPIESLLPGTTPPPADASQSVKLGQDIRQLLRSGKTVDALRIAIDSAPLGGDESAKRTHLTTVVEVLQGIRQSDVPRVLARLADGDGGMARADCLMKYLYEMFLSAKSKSPVMLTVFSQVQRHVFTVHVSGTQNSRLSARHRVRSNTIKKSWRRRWWASYERTSKLAREASGGRRRRWNSESDV